MGCGLKPDTRLAAGFDRKRAVCFLGEAKTNGRSTRLRCMLLREYRGSWFIARLECRAGSMASAKRATGCEWPL